MLENYIKLEREFRGYMSEVWATPDPKSALWYAVTEYAEYVDAFIRESRPNDTRNAAKAIDSRKELSQCWFMLLTALSGQIRRKDTLRNANQMFMSQNVWLKSFISDGDGLVLIGLALNSNDYLAITKAFSWVHNKLIGMGNLSESVLEVMEIWHNKFYAKKHELDFDKEKFANLLVDSKDLYFQDMIEDLPIQHRFEWATVIDYNVEPEITDEERLERQEMLENLIREAKSNQITNHTDFYGFQDYQDEELCS